jgi:hypothetical protein
MYNTEDCARLGVFKVKDAVKSFDLTKDSKYLIAIATTFGVHIFNVFDGELINKIKTPGSRKKQVEFALGEKQYLVLSDIGST